MLLVVRHGETAANAAGLLLGRLDPPLTELGLAQARSLREAVGHATRAVVSPLLRARQTAEALGLDVTVDGRWVEIDYGIHDGTPLGRVPKDLWDQWRADLAFAPEGGESLEEVGRRVAAACQDLAEEAAESDVVVVSHVSPIKAAVAWALGVDQAIAWRTFLDVASVTRIGLANGRPVLRSFNETHHLAGLD